MEIASFNSAEERRIRRIKGLKYDKEIAEENE
jgi:hypothetical protein